jgi:hypothetical protein
MNPVAKDALLAVGEYIGSMDAFLRESSASIRAALKCSDEESQCVLKAIRDSGEMDFRMTQWGELPQGDIPFARWYWYIRDDRLGYSLARHPGPVI